jgi:hypothetical protein
MHIFKENLSIQSINRKPLSDKYFSNNIFSNHSLAQRGGQKINPVNSSYIYNMGIADGQLRFLSRGLPKFTLTPKIRYDNAEKYKHLIFKENKNKSFVYR